jgi:hypothetical protein
MTKWTLNEIIDALKDGYEIRKDNYELTYRLVNRNCDYDIEVAYLTFNQFVKLDLVESDYTTLYTYYKIK